jgi:2-polyprenyl-6-methoxyphenol hydroxylase-like FAD-dependent oxidoreductase
MRSVRAAVVGAGIGGLSAALALRAAGAEVRVYEQTAELGEVGAGVGLYPNSMRVLHRLGVADAVTRRAAPVNEWWTLAPGGPVLSHQVVGSDGPIGFLGMYRPDLVSALAAALPCGALHTGHRCVAFDQDDRSAVLTFDNGVSVEADVVIAADGIHSALQRYVVEYRPPVFSGVAAYRGVMPAGRMPDWMWPHALVNWVGQGKHFLVFPVRAGTLLNYVGFLPADKQMRESWSAPGDPAVLAAEFSDWDPWLSRLISQIDVTFRWGLYDHDPLPRWTNGRLALLGDAAHAMLPHMGQGANQSIEDGMALATLIRDTDAVDVAHVLIRYQALRHGRTARVQKGSRANGIRMDSGQAVIIARPGVQDYDVEAEARAMR